jgi:phage-related baseplate assembly protein
VSPPELWVPGYAGPLDDLIDRIHRRIEQFAGEVGAEQAYVEIELVDGVRYTVESLSPEPGYGFITIRPHPGDGTPAEVILPVGSIRRIELSGIAEKPTVLGFSVPQANP